MNVELYLAKEIETRTGLSASFSSRLAKQIIRTQKARPICEKENQHEIGNSKSKERILL